MVRFFMNQTLISIFVLTDKPVTLIDTPGFGVTDINKETDHIEQLVDLLKDEIKWVHVFIIAMEGEKARYDEGLDSMLKLFANIFSNYFWKNAMIEATKYGFSDIEIKERRRLNGDEYTEETWKEKRIAQVKERLPKALVSF